MAREQRPVKYRRDNGISADLPPENANYIVKRSSQTKEKGHERSFHINHAPIKTGRTPPTIDLYSTLPAAFDSTAARPAPVGVPGPGFESEGDGPGSEAEDDGLGFEVEDDEFGFEVEDDGLGFKVEDDELGCKAEDDGLRFEVEDDGPKFEVEDDGRSAALGLVAA